jgi:DNA ligase-1
MQLWAAELAEIPDWLFHECYEAVGDLAETITSVLPESSVQGPKLESLQFWVEQRLLPLAGLEEGEQKLRLMTIWSELDRDERFVFTKLLTGSFRVGVSQDLVVRSLAEMSGIAVPVLAHRLMGTWRPTATFFESLVQTETSEVVVSQPYPFCLAHPLDQPVEALGPVDGWLAEYKWDGIRAQIVHRGNETFVWSRGEELITDRFPEIAVIGAGMPNGCVVDGEILAWQDDKPRPFLDLQKRIGRKTVGKKLLADVPVALVAFDLLEWEGADLRDRSLMDRRVLLESWIAGLGDAFAIRLSPRIAATSWADVELARSSARNQGVEGLMLKQVDSAYGVGRKKGSWWKWKVEPFTVDAVLIYAQRGSGRRASLYTDYTFGIWNDGQLVSFAKAYSGLSDAEIRQVDNWIRKNTLERAGPVRIVKPELVMELAFEAIQPSSRHKSGLAVRFPRISRWRHDKLAEQADSLDTILGLLNSQV